MIDKIEKFKGHVTIETLDVDGNVVDRYMDPNLIMVSARVDMAEVIGGVAAGSPINKLVLGTEGHNVDILVPKTETEGFVNTRTELFSEETPGYTYPISFTNNAAADADGTVDSEPDSGSTVHRLQTGSQTTWTFTIPLVAANNGAAVIYTEAALYAGTKIFSMKTFAGKIKDNTVTLRVIWKIIF